MAVVHIVLFKLKATSSEADIRELCDDFLALKSKCVHPSSGEPYIVNSSGGKDISPENAQRGFTHGFVAEFANVKDRDYYLNDDADHKAFVKKHSPQIDQVLVIDYEKGAY